MAILNTPPNDSKDLNTYTIALICFMADPLCKLEQVVEKFDDLGDDEDKKRFIDNLRLLACEYMDVNKLQAMTSLLGDLNKSLVDSELEQQAIETKKSVAEFIASTTELMNGSGKPGLVAQNKDRYRLFITIYKHYLQTVLSGEKPSRLDEASINKLNASKLQLADTLEKGDTYRLELERITGKPDDSEDAKNKHPEIPIPDDTTYDSAKMGA